MFLTMTIVLVAETNKNDGCGPLDEDINVMEKYFLLHASLIFIYISQTARSDQPILNPSLNSRDEENPIKT